MSEQDRNDKRSEEEQKQERSPKPRERSAGKPARDSEEGTISLLDLIRDTKGADEPGLDDDETAEIPTPLVVQPPDKDERTVTLGKEPQTETDLSAPLPLSAEDLHPPKERPLQRDTEATEVRPRSAFSLADRPTPVEEQPTQVLDAGAAAAGTRQARAAGAAVPPPSARAAASTPARQTAPPLVTTPPVRRSWGGCVGRLLLFSVVAGIVLFAIGIAAAAIGYTGIARTLPPPSELSARASAFETVRIYDRNGSLLYSQADPNTGNRLYVPLDQISPHLINATIATEDSRFYQNPGFDVFGIARAIMQAAQEGETISGTSTITQQLVRAVLLDEEERTERTFRRKVREIILAAEISRTYEKNEILELYLNEIYYGNLAYGIEAASQTYFDKPAAELDLAEATLLAGLPQAPALWDPYSAPEKALGRQSEVLSLMIAEGYISVTEARVAQDEANQILSTMSPPTVTIKHPHFTLTVLQQAEDILGAQSIYRGGLRIYTTLDPDTQRLAETTIADHRASINAAGANNASMVVLKPDSGDILALVGSADFQDEAISGQVNMALSPRQPGSSIKPLVYLSTMERGWTPATLLWDVPTQFNTGTGIPYEPKNYDDQFHGPLRLRLALGNSYNIPAVKALEYVGVCHFIANMQKLGLSDLYDAGCAETAEARDHGLSLALGGGEVSPLQMAGAFSALANEGRFMAPFAISRIEDSRGEILYDHASPDPRVTQVVRPEHAYLLSDILSDDDARQPAFGRNSSLVIPGRSVAVKTGTSGTSAQDVRDAWTIGYTPDVVTAVWVGNTDNEPIGAGESGTRLAAPIWNSFMSQYLANQPPASFTRPAGVVDIEICSESGTVPNAACASRRQEIFAADQPPLDSSHDFIQSAAVDLWTQLLATDHCPESVYNARFFNVLVSGNDNVRQREINNAQLWLEQTEAGRNWAARHDLRLPLRYPPNRSCDGNTPRPQAAILQPGNGAQVANVVQVMGSAYGPGYTGYEVEYGLGYDPGGWGAVSGFQQVQVDNGLLTNWDTTQLGQSGPVTLRLVVYGPDNPYTAEQDPVSIERRVVLTALQPTPTPTATPTNTPTPPPTATITPTPTTAATATPLPTLIVESATPVVIETIAPPASATPEPTAYP